MPRSDLPMRSSGSVAEPIQFSADVHPSGPDGDRPAGVSNS